MLDEVNYDIRITLFLTKVIFISVESSKSGIMLANTTFVYLSVCLYVCLRLNNSRMAEPIGLKLIACLLLGPGMVLC